MRLVTLNNRNIEAELLGYHRLDAVFPPVDDDEPAVVLVKFGADDRPASRNRRR